MVGKREKMGLRGGGRRENRVLWWGRENRENGVERWGERERMGLRDGEREREWG